MCLTLCDAMDYSPLGSSVYVILQVRILEWVAIPPPWNLPNPEDPTHVSSVSCIGRWILYY